MPVVGWLAFRPQTNRTGVHFEADVFRRSLSSCLGCTGVQMNQTGAKSLLKYPCKARVFIQHVSLRMILYWQLFPGPFVKYRPGASWRYGGSTVLKEKRWLKQKLRKTVSEQRVFSKSKVSKLNLLPHSSSPDQSSKPKSSLQWTETHISSLVL